MPPVRVLRVPEFAQVWGVPLPVPRGLVGQVAQEDALPLWRAVQQLQLVRRAQHGWTLRTCPV